MVRHLQTSVRYWTLTARDLNDFRVRKLPPTAIPKIPGPSTGWSSCTPTPIFVDPSALPRDAPDLCSSLEMIMKPTLRTRLTRRVTTLLALAALASACASSPATSLPPGARALGDIAYYELPTSQEVQELAAAPAPPIGGGLVVSPIITERWELVAPLPSVIGHLSRQTLEPWEQDFAQQVDGLEQTARSEASTCIARQTAHVFMTHARRPDPE